MKKYIVLLALCAIFGLNMSKANAGVINFFPELTQSEYNAGNKIKMSWTSEELAKKLKLAIYLQSTEKGFLYPIKRKVKQNGTFTWKIPKDIASATDYQLSMSTEDKGPSVSSDNSATFSIIGKKKNEQYLKKFEPKISGKKIDVSMQRKNGQRMGLNITCKDDEVKLSQGKNPVRCNTWHYFDKNNGKMSLTYEKLSASDVKVYFVLDLYDASGMLVQRQFKDVTLAN